VGPWREPNLANTILTGGTMTLNNNRLYDSIDEMAFDPTRSNNLISPYNLFNWRHCKFRLSFARRVFFFPLTAGLPRSTCSICRGLPFGLWTLD